MKFRKSRYLLSFAVILLFGIAANSADYIKVVSLGDRIETPAYSILPPQEAGWSYVKENPIKVSFGKIGDKEGQSFSGMVGLSRMPQVNSKKEFFDAISAQRGRDSKDSRFEDLQNETSASIENGLYIFHFYKKYKDYGANNLPKSSPYLVIEDIGSILQHPNNRGVAVTITLSQRSLPSDLLSSFNTLARGFVSSIEFRDFNE